jgi:hypothetical protein
MKLFISVGTPAGQVYSLDERNEGEAREVEVTGDDLREFRQVQAKWQEWQTRLGSVFARAAPPPAATPSS